MNAIPDMMASDAEARLRKFSDLLAVGLGEVKFISPAQRARAIELSIRLSEVLGLPEE